VSLRSAVRGSCPRLTDRDVSSCLRAGLLRVVDESPDDGQSDVHGQRQGELVTCREGREELGQLLPAVAQLVVKQCPAGIGDGYQSGPPVSGIVDPGHQTLPLQPLNKFGHRRLADACRRGQCRHPGWSFPIQRAQRQVGSQTQSGANTQVPNHEDRRLFKPLDSDLSADTAV
jgi:hypothetical protein